MEKPVEIEFKVSNWSVSSEFGVFWWSNDLTPKHKMNLSLEGFFTINDQDVFGSVHMSSALALDAGSASHLDSELTFEEKRSDINIGGIRVDPTKPNALLRVPELFVSNLQSLLIHGNNEIVITMLTYETVLYQREVASVSLRATPRPVVEKTSRWFF